MTKLILFLILIWAYRYLIVFIIDTLKGESTSLKKYKNRNLQKSVEKKLQTGEEFNKEEEKYFYKQQRLNELLQNLNKNK